MRSKYIIIFCNIALSDTLQSTLFFAAMRFIKINNLLKIYQRESCLNFESKYWKLNGQSMKWLIFQIYFKVLVSTKIRNCQTEIMSNELPRLILSFLCFFQLCYATFQMSQNKIQKLTKIKFDISITIGKFFVSMILKQHEREFIVTLMLSSIDIWGVRAIAQYKTGTTEFVCCSCYIFFLP